MKRRERVLRETVERRSYTEYIVYRDRDVKDNEDSAEPWVLYRLGD